MENSRLRGFCGIYAIRRIGTNDCSIGYSGNIPRRWGEHRRKLRRNKHSNPYLQNAWNKYGEDAFEFIVLEECSHNEAFLMLAEADWMEKTGHSLNPRQYYPDLSPRDLSALEAMRKAYRLEIEAESSADLDGKHGS
ncbi:MAG TPA: GIY-YIG nuclease family protein [Rhodocyclaceae bacterium]|nr:GIY-YIG nuclease family protein [Rhodocyclaceae bacterium]